LACLGNVSNRAELAAGLEWERARDWVCLAKVLKVTL